MQAQDLHAQPDTDGDARAMKGSVAGYNVQSVLDAKYRLIATHDDEAADGWRTVPGPRVAQG